MLRFYGVGDVDTFRSAVSPTSLGTLPSHSVAAARHSIPPGSNTAGSAVTCRLKFRVHEFLSSLYATCYLSDHARCQSDYAQPHVVVHLGQPPMLQQAWAAAGQQHPLLMAVAAEAAAAAARSATPPAAPPLGPCSHRHPPVIRVY